MRRKEIWPVIPDVWEAKSWFDLRVLWPTKKTFNEWSNKINQLTSVYKNL